MRCVALFLLLAGAPAVSAVLSVKNAQEEQQCTSQDLQHRMELQAKLKGICEDMCKEVGAYPKCNQCAGFQAPDSTPGVMTWDELLEHMDNLSDWGHDEIKDWTKEASRSGAWRLPDASVRCLREERGVDVWRCPGFSRRRTQRPASARAQLSALGDLA